MAKVSKLQYIILLFAIFLQSFVSVFSKLAGGSETTLGFLLYYGGSLFILAIYSVIWQLLLEKVPLSTAYMSRALIYLFMLIWSVVIFGEGVKPTQIIGVAVILFGVYLSVRDE